MDLPISSKLPQSAAAAEPFGNSIGSSAGKAARMKLEKAAQQFEAFLLSSVLDQMQKSFSGSLGDDTDPAAGTLTGLSISAVSSAMAAAGGIGLAKMALRHLQPAADVPKLLLQEPKVFPGTADYPGKE